MFGFVLADLRRNWIGALAIGLIVALATALGVVVTLQERALRLGSARAAAGFDLVIGAPGSETQLVLSSVFLQASPLPLTRGDVLAGLLEDPRVDWAAPVGFGDMIEGHPVVGTTGAMIAGLGGVAEGRGFARLGEAVAGALVPMEIGAEFHPVHAELARTGEVHMGAEYTIIGRMKPTGTPWDRAVLVPIEAVWQVHDHGHDHGEAEDAHADHAGHGHGGFDAAALIREEALGARDAPGVPAIVVKPRSFGDAYALRRDYRSEHTVAVFPAEVLTRLYGTLGDARRVLSAVALGAQGLVAASILLVVVLHVLQRRRQIGALRAFGAPRKVVFAIVWLESLLILGAGQVAGYGLGWIGARVISARIEAVNGVAMPVGFTGQDGWFLAGLLAVCALAVALPAALAYRQSPASALRA